jgi:CBS domain-containing protein
MQASDVMTYNVVSVEPDSSITAAARLMLQKHLSGLPVIDAAGTLVGIITEGDFLRRAETGTERHRSRWLEFLIGPGALADDYVRSSGRKVCEVMTRDVYTVSETTALQDVVKLMEQRRIKRVPVVRGQSVVGMITRANLMRALIHLSLQEKPSSPGDTEIRERLLNELNRHSWAPLALINIAVNDGVVKLSGALMDERERQALRVAAENVPGVKKVEDELVWIDPMLPMAV